MKIVISSALAVAALVAVPANAALPATVTALIDTSADPCEDFYQYSCGNWLKNNEIPKTDVSIDASFTAVSDRNEKVIMDIVKQNWPLVGELWDSCTDVETLNALGNKPLQRILGRIATASSKTDLFKIAGDLSRVGGSLITSIDVAGDSRDAKTNVLYVGSADMTLPDPAYYSNKEWLAENKEAYLNYIESIMKLAGVGGSGGQGQGQGQGKPSGSVGATIFAIEEKIANIFNEVEDQTGDDAWYHPTTLGEAMTKYPLTIGSYVEGLGLLEKATKLTKSSKVVFSFFDYFDKAEKVVADIGIKDLRTYVAFQFVNARVRQLSDGFFDAHFKFFGTVLNGQQQPAERPTHCTYRLLQFFPDLIGKYYFMKMFDKEREDNAQLMTKLIEEAMGEHIAHLDWLDTPTRNEAANKLAKVANLIGQSTVKTNYPYVLKTDEYFNNVLTIIGTDFDKKIKKIGTPVNRQEWSMSAAQVNAYYSPLENKMVFPAAILQPPFFNGTSHPAQNFGSIGAVIGHELTHGFDSSGRKYDGDGNKRMWWSKSTSDEFDKRATCMRKQYSSFDVIGEKGTSIGHVNGNLTITENIADNGGVSLSWDAYHKYVKSPEAKNLGGVTEAEGEQLFFISFAQTWCGKYHDGALSQLITGDPHSPGKFRANGVAMNSAEFSKVFQCKATSKMNPETKCKLW